MNGSIVFFKTRLMGCLLLAVSFEKKLKSMTSIVWSSNEAINIVVKLTIGQDEIEIIEQKFLQPVCVCKYTNATSMHGVLHTYMYMHGWLSSFGFRCKICLICTTIHFLTSFRRQQSYQLFLV